MKYTKYTEYKTQSIKLFARFLSFSFVNNILLTLQSIHYSYLNTKSVKKSIWSKVCNIFNKKFKYYLNTFSNTVHI